MEKSMNNDNRQKSYTDKVAEKIIASLEDGTAPWIRPWSGAELSAVMPINPVTNKPYKGINFINLSMEQMALGSSDPRWLTYKQAASIGAQVRQGEKGTTIQYWKFTEEVEKTDEKGKTIYGEDGKPEKVTVQLENPKAFFSTVFNATQIDGMPELVRDTRPEKTFEAIEAAERILANSGAMIRHVEGGGAFYRPQMDDITLPMKYQFNSQMGYYSTALHELGHWTGHPSRLDRDLSHSFGTQGYAKEELRAEIASYMLCSELGVDFDPSNHHAYIKSWVSNLRDKPNEIFKAAADAGKITQMLQGFNMELEQTQAQNQTLTDDQKMLMDRLALSTLTPGVYTPSEAMKDKAETHVVVFAGDKPLILTGSIDDHASHEQAQALVKSEAFVALLKKSGYSGNVRYAELASGAIEWQDKYSAIVAKESGKIENGTEKGDLMAVILADDLPLATVMCVDSEIAKAIDPLSPLPNTREYGHEAQDEYEGMARHVAMEKEVDAQFRASLMSTPKKYSETSQFPDFESLKEYVNDLRREYPNFITTQGVSMMNSSLYSNYMMADKELTEIKYLHVTHDGRQEWESISPEVAKKRLENAYFSQKIKEWGLDQVQEKDYHADPLVSETKRLTDITRFNETDLSDRVAAARFNNYHIPPEAVEDALSRYGTVRLDDQQLGDVWAEIKVDDELFVLHKVKDDAIITPRESWNDTLFEDLKSPHTVLTKLTPQPEKETSMKSNTFIEKTFLAVSYRDKDIAKRHGAKWDKDAKLWYAPVGAEIDKLAEFIPENAEAQAMTKTPEPVDQKDVIAQFKQALEDRGLIIDGDPIMDSGKLIRVPVQGDKLGDRSGAYMAYTDGRPAGIIQNWREGTKDKWVANGDWQSVSPEEAAAQRAKMAQNKADRERERLEGHNNVSVKVRTEFKEARDATDQHPYLVEKGVQNHGLKLDARGNLLMPLSDVEGKIWTAQHIGVNGYKGFEPDGKKEGNFYLIGASSIEDVATAVICEGYATGASIFEATNQPVIVAVDAGNLVNVANAIHEKFPEKPIVIAADDDIQKEQAGKDNVGRLKAEAAAAAVKGIFIAPRFTPDEIGKGSTDFNDLAKSRGLEEVRKQLDIALDQVRSRDHDKAKDLSQGQTQTMQRELRRQVVRQTSFNM